MAKNNNSEKRELDRWGGDMGFKVTKSPEKKSKRPQKKGTSNGKGK